MSNIKRQQPDPDLLFFIIIFLLLFYDGSFLKYKKPSVFEGDSSILFFILIFLKLFY